MCCKLGLSGGTTTSASLSISRRSSFNWGINLKKCTKANLWTRLYLMSFLIWRKQGLQKIRCPMKIWLSLKFSAMRRSRLRWIGKILKTGRTRTRYRKRRCSKSRSQTSRATQFKEWEPSLTQFPQSMRTRRKYCSSISTKRTWTIWRKKRPSWFRRSRT